MDKILRAIWTLRIWKDRRGQDLVEYALLAGFVAVGAGVFVPDVSNAMSTIYSRVASRLVEAGG